jgi:PmbA protein
MDEGPDLARLEELAGALVAAAKRAGADAADAVVAAGRALSIEVRDGALEQNERAEGDTLGLRAFVGRRQAIVASSDLAPGGFAALAERAVAMARVAPEDAFAGLAEPARLVRGPAIDLDLHDPTSLSPEALESLARRAEDAALAVAGVSKSAGASASQSHDGSVLVTSDGFAGAYRRSTFSLAMTAIAGEGTGMQRDYDYAVRAHRDDLDPPERIGRVAGERAVAALAPRKLATGRAPVIFDRRVATTLVGHLTGAASGAAVARKTSFLRERLGARVFAPGVRVTDDPLRPRALRSRPFDDEGVASRPLALVEDGHLRSWILDSATARELGLATTGHAARGAGSAPSPAPSNVTLEAGRRSPTAMMKDLGRGLLVTQLIGHGANLVTGDYSRGCFGFWFEDGAIAYPVAEITIAGHLNDIFAALEPADDLEFRFATNAPSVYVGELTIGGA